MREIRDETGSQRLIGYVLSVPEDGDVLCHLEVGPQHLNRHGMLHGGISAMLLDSACGIAASRHFDPETLSPVLTVSMATQYVAPVGRGRVTAIGTVVGAGRSVCHVEGRLRDHQGRLIVSALGVFKRARPGSPA